MARSSEGIKIDVVGIAHLLRKLDTFEKAVSKKILNKGLRAGTKIIATAVKQYAPVSPKRKGKNLPKRGRIKRAVKVRAMKRSRVRVGFNVSIGKKMFTGQEFWAGFVEYGTKSRRTKKGFKRGRLMGRGFMRKAMIVTQKQAFNAAKEIIEQGIEAEVKRLGAQNLTPSA